MIVVRRHVRLVVNEISRRTFIPERIPHYQERSALLPSGVNTPFPIVVVPDIDLELLFKSHERLQENLQRRHWIVDVKKVEADYELWKKLDQNLADASARRIPVRLLIDVHSIKDRSHFHFSPNKFDNGVNNSIL